MLSRDLMHAHTSMCLNKVVTDPELSERYNVLYKMFIGCSSLNITRSIALTEWFQNSFNGDLFLFIDADQMFTPKDVLKAISLLHETESDVVCGAYPRHDDKPTCKAYDQETFLRENHGKLKYGATGFMLISKRILDTMDLMPVHVENRTDNVIPYFQSRVVEESQNINLWLAEDYSFCWLVRRHKGKIYGFISPTLGHILSSHKYLT
jgi:cellulose synthase/poly-beta-1,6-N-acetylglucosamine synthase-like glycosyltransferase